MFFAKKKKNKKRKFLYKHLDYFLSCTLSFNNEFQSKKNRIHNMYLDDPFLVLLIIMNKNLSHNIKLKRESFHRVIVIIIKRQRLNSTVNFLAAGGGGQRRDERLMQERDGQDLQV